MAQIKLDDVDPFEAIGRHSLSELREQFDEDEIIDLVKRAGLATDKRSAEHFIATIEDQDQDGDLVDIGG